MKLAVGADHGGAEQKMALLIHLESQGHAVFDFGVSRSDESVDYPQYALAVAQAVASGEAEFGILVCGTGIGMAIAANKVKGVRAATITDINAAHLARAHNNANVLALSGRFTPLATNIEIVDTFLSTAFEGGRHQRRIDLITAAETQESANVKD